MRHSLLHSALLVAFCLYRSAAHAEEKALQLKQTIPLPGVEGRIDHLALDSSAERLFVCALGNNTVEVLDLRKGGYGVKETVTSGQWHTLRVEFAGNHFKLIFDGKHLFAVEDTTFTEAGKVGVWTKADSVTLFDNFTYAGK